MLLDSSLDVSLSLIWFSNNNNVATVLDIQSIIYYNYYYNNNHKYSAHYPETQLLAKDLHDQRWSSYRVYNAKVWGRGDGKWRQTGDVRRIRL